MRKIFVMMLLANLITAASFAQPRTTVNGNVKDNNGKALAAVTVSLLKAKDSSLVKADVTDAAGHFEIAVNRADQYLLSYSLVGFEKKYTQPFTLSEGQQYTASPVSLSNASNKLQDVTVSSRKPMIEVKADKTVFNVENSINASGSNALELLQKSPGMMVDNNDNISMKGKSGVKVYIDGKLTQMGVKDLAAYLRSINSNDIEAIEMISNPSAKYDASGNAGIVNIRLKKNKKFGMNGSVNAGVSQGVTPKGSASVNLNYRDKKVNLFGNVSGNMGRYENTLDLYRIQGDTIYDQHSTSWSNNKNMNVKAGADYFINNKSTIGFLARTSFSDNGWDGKSIAQKYRKSDNVFVETLKATNSMPSKRQNHNFNVNYRYADTSGLEVNFDGDYGIFRAKGSSYQPNNYYDGNNNFLRNVTNSNITPTDIDIYTAKVDVEQKFFGGKLGYGVKSSYVQTKNAFEFFNVNGGVPTKNLQSSNSFNYKENVNAAYVNFNRQLNEKWSVQLGARVEHTHSVGDLTRADGTVQADNKVDRNYVDLFPSGALTWTVNKKNSLNLTYSKRIDRPSYQDLNPFENKLDELTYQKGNAFLKPQYTDNIELTHTFMGFINTTLGYAHVKDFSTEITDTVKNATYIQQRNLAQQQILSASIGSPLPIQKWWNGYVNLWFSYQMFEGQFKDNKIDLDIPMYGAYMQHTFTLGKDYSAELSGWFNGPSVWGGTWKTKSQYGIDAGVQKQLFEKKATLKLSVTDIFFSNPWKAKTDYAGVVINGGGTWESRTVRLNFTYRFGNNQVKAARQRQTGLEQESKRIK
jgi:iron complex outermembrane recepter protein